MANLQLMISVLISELLRLVIRALGLVGVAGLEPATR